MSIVRSGKFLLDTETGELIAPLIGAKGSTTVQPPSPTEQALQAKQLKMLTQQERLAYQQFLENDALAPLVYAQMGVKRIEDPTRQTTITDLTNQLAAEKAILGKMGTPVGVVYENGRPIRIREEGGTRRIFGAEDLSDKLGPGKHIFNPGGIFGGRDEVYRDFTPAEKKWAQQRIKVQNLANKLKAAKDSPTKYSFEKMTDEEKLAQMSPAERQAYDITMLANDRTKKALEGKLDIDPSVEQDIARGKAQLERELYQSLGPGAEGSDSWNRAISEFDRNMNTMRYSIRHGEMTTSDAIASNRVNESARRREQTIGNFKDATSNYPITVASLATAGQGAESALSRLYGMRRDRASIDQQNAASRGAEMGGYINAGAGIAGTVGGIALIAI